MAVNDGNSEGDDHGITVFYHMPRLIGHVEQGSSGRLNETDSPIHIIKQNKK